MKNYLTKEILQFPKLTCLLGISVLLATAVSAQTSLYWYPSGANTSAGGSGNWSTATSAWNSASNGTGSQSAWVTGNNAVFNDSTSGTVTLTEAISANNINIGGSSNYTFSGSKLSLTQSGLGGTVIGVATNSSTVTFNNAIDFAGSGKINATFSDINLTFNNTMTLTGATASEWIFRPVTSDTTVINLNGNIERGTGAGALRVTFGESISSNSTPSTINISGNNSGINNNFIVYQGDIKLYNNNALGSSSNTVVMRQGNSGNVNSGSIRTGTSGLTIANNINIQGTNSDTSDVRILGGAHTSGTSTFSGTITIQGSQAQAEGIQLASATGGTTVFSGLIDDGANSVKFTKIGGGIVNLTKATGNTYDGGTTVTDGTLLVNNTSGSGTGTGLVQVNAGTLGGSGFVSGAVTIGDGSGSSDAFMAPGNSIGTFTSSSSITFASDSTFLFELNSSTLGADMITGLGFSISSSSLFDFTDLGSGTITPGTDFLVLNNTDVSSIVGSFGNLIQGSSFTVGSNTFQVDYSGGDGNDLVLTTVAVPEPSTMALVGGTVAFALAMVRRNRKKRLVV